MTKLEGLKGEIKTIHELEDITKVLEQTAARDIAQMRERILKSRPFFTEAWKVYRVLQQVAPTPPEVLNKHLVIIVTLNWGMTGDLLNRVVSKGDELYEKHEADLLITGKMGRDRFVNRNERTVHLFNVPKKATYNDIESLRKVVAKYAFIHFVYPRFISLSKQEIAVASLSTEKEKQTDDQLVSAERFLIEPNPQEVVNYMNEAIVGIIVYNYFSEALLAYSAAQMIAMRGANDNAKEEGEVLKFKYNKAKRELIDSKLRELYEFKFHEGDEE